MPSIDDCYRILELQPGASLKEVKAAYRKLVRLWHPDRYGHDKKMQFRAQEQLKAINNAYAILSEHLGSDKASHKQKSYRHNQGQQKAKKKEETRRQHEEAKQRQEQTRQAQERKRQEQEAAEKKKRQQEARSQRQAYILNILKSKKSIAILSCIAVFLIWFLAQMLYNDYMFNSMFGEANTALGSKDYKKASEFYEKVCKIYGRKNGVTKQPELINLKNYSTYMHEAENAMSTKDYEKAKDAYKNAMGVPGYDGDEDVKRFLKIINNRIADIKKQKEFDENIRKKNELSDIQKRKEDEKKKATDSENRCSDLRRKAEAVEASIYTPIFWNGAASTGSEAKKKYAEGDFVKSQELWNSAAEVYAKAVSEIEKKRNDAETTFKSASARVNKDIIPTIKDSTRSYAERMKACDEGLTTLSDVSILSHLKTSSKTELSELQSQIRNLKSSLYPSQKIDNLKSETVSLATKSPQLPADFEMVKEPASDTGNWAAVILHKKTGIEMVYVPPGEFMMGSTIQEQDEAVQQESSRDWIKGEFQHRVKLTKGYYIGKHEVTQGQWEKVMGNNPSSFKNSGKDAPVESVSWDNCLEFCRKVGGDFRLPTEAEWEFASRGGNKSKGFIYIGSNNLDEVGWYDKNSGIATHHVGQKKPNELGLYDMSGNVWEWCADWYGDYPSGNITNPTGALTGSVRVLRGGSWDYSAGRCRPAARLCSVPKIRYFNYGFRVAMDIPSAEERQQTATTLSPSITSNNLKTETSNQIQQQKTDLFFGKDWTIPEIGMEFIWIKSLDCWAGKYEVTNGEYRKFKPYHNSKDYNGNSLNTDRQPVVYVNFDDATEYAKWLTDQEREAGRIPAGFIYRLPSEKEWTTFCQSGNKRKYHWGNEMPPKYGNYQGEETKFPKGMIIIGYNDGFPVSCPVEKSGKNDWGLYGVGGNVWELTVKSPTALSFDACRGASWDGYDLYSLHSSFRLDNLRGYTSNRNAYIGFRLVLGTTVAAELKQDTVAQTTVAPETVVDYNSDKSELNITDINQNKQFDTIPVSGNDWTVPNIGMKFVWIKSLEYWVGKYEVTNGEYRKFNVNHDSKVFEGNSLNGDRQPVVYVNFDDATEYAKWLTDQEREAGRIPAGFIYRLPSEKEWTTFCQCGDNRDFPWGDEIPPKYGNYTGQESTWKYRFDGYNDGFPVSCPVEKSGKNDWGLYGVGGNVWELTVKSPTALSFDACRGASWRCGSPSSWYSTYRCVSAPLSRTTDFGFRLVLGTADDTELKLNKDANIDQPSQGNNNTMNGMTNGKNNSIDLLKEFESGKWTNLLDNRGKLVRWENSYYRVMPTPGSGSDFGLSYPINKPEVNFEMKFRLMNIGAIQIVFENEPQIISGHGVALSYKWNKGISVGDLSSRGKDMKTVEIPDLYEGWHTIKITAKNGYISASVDNGKEIEWEGDFKPKALTISGDEFIDWFIMDMKLK